MPNIKLTLAYDGRAYLGWQNTNVGRSLEEALRAVLEKVLQEKIPLLQAASRTDAGVHAVGQIVNFHTSHEDLNLSRLKMSLNRLLPKDLCIQHVEVVADDFHPTLDCLSKEYYYTISYGPIQLPCHRFYAWHYTHQLDVVAMRQAALILEGEHDFTAFCNVRRNHTYANYVRHVHSIMIDELPDNRLCIRIRGNNFLYKMVRNMVGTLAFVGSGKIAVDDVTEILANRKRPQAGMTAPAHGLCLYRVYYE